MRERIAKKGIKKRLFSLMLTLVVSLTIVSFNSEKVYAAQEYISLCDGDWYYSLNNLKSLRTGDTFRIQSVDADELNYTIKNYYADGDLTGTLGHDDLTPVLDMPEGKKITKVETTSNSVVITLDLLHDHFWQYVASDNKIETYCKNDSCPSGTDATNKISLTLSATSPNYSGNAATITIGTEAENQAWEDAGLTVPTTISYEKADGTKLTSAPTTVGSYVAKVSPVGVTATAKVSFTIEQNHEANTSKYSFDNTNHWNPCKRTDCTEKFNSASHSYSETTHKCVCGKTNPDNNIHTYGEWSVTKLATASEAGAKEHSCKVCAHKETVETTYEKPENHPEVDSNVGKIENITDSSKNGCTANVEISKTEIIDKFELSKEELSKVENGVDISVNLEVKTEEQKEIPQADKTVAEKKIASGEKIGQYLDINLFKIVGDSKSKVTQLNGKIKIEIKLPEDIKKAGTDYFIIRVHEGVATKLDLTLVSDDTYSFETDQFSTYAIGYKDSTAEAAPTAPKTGDATNMYQWILLMVAGLGVFGMAYSKKHKEN